MIQRNLFYLLLKLISSIPYSFGNPIHKFCTYFLKSVIKYRKSVIFENLSQAFPAKNQAEIALVAHEYYLYLSAYLFETIHIYAKKNISNHIEFFNIDALKSSLQEGKSVMILGSHYGNWEWSSMLLPCHLNHDVYAIYKPLVNKKMDALVKEWRANYGLKLLAMDDVVKHLSTCKRPSVYIFVSDQRPTNNKTGRWIKFLNQDTLFYEGASVLSKRYKADLIYQKIMVDKGHYQVRFEHVNGNAVDFYVSHLEKDIIQHPAPWLWSHNRWKFKRNETTD